MSIKFPSEKDDDFPVNPIGDKVTEQYWMGIQGAVNRCGDTYLELWRDYKDYSPLQLNQLDRMSDNLNALMRIYGQVVFGVVVSVFFENLHGDEDLNIFNMGIVNYYHAMPTEIFETVERLRFINSKFIEKSKTIASQLRGDHLTS